MQDQPLTRDPLPDNPEAARRQDGVAQAAQIAQLQADLRRAQETVLATLDSIPDGFLIVDRGGRILFLNKQIEQCVHDPRPSAALIGESLWTLYPTFAEAPAQSEFSRVFQDQASVTFDQFYPPLGKWFEVRACPAPAGAAVYLRDITERKKAAEHRLALERKLLEAQKLDSLGVLAGGIAHDFNNLLVSVMGNAGLALMELAPEAPARQSIERIEAAAQRAADLTKQMLAYSGKGRFLMRRVNLSSIIEEMAHLLQVSTPGDVVLRYHLGRDLPPILGDPPQLRQVLMNVVVNAAEAIGERQGLVTLTTGLVQADKQYLARTFLVTDLPEGTYVFLEVADTGCGMDAETMSKIFDPFFTTKFAGRGLGLAAVLGIVRGHRGTLRVYSEVGHGTTFKILLPALDAPAPAAEPCPPVATAGSGIILVIDDEADVRNVTRQMLERMGFQVLTADGARAGIALFRTNLEAISCTLLDLTMPEMNGEEVFRALRQMHPAARVVIMSGYSEIDATTRFAGKGLAGYVEKPFTFALLQERLRQAFARLPVM